MEYFNWTLLSERTPPNNNGIPKSYAVKNGKGQMDEAIYGSSGAFNEPLSFFEPKNRRFKSSEIVAWAEMDKIFPLTGGRL